MYELHVRPEHEHEAILQLKQAGMTVADPFAVIKTAKDIANPMPEQEAPTVAWEIAR